MGPEHRVRATRHLHWPGYTAHRLRDSDDDLCTLPAMPLEATMMIIDNSEYMRNGDYLPSRFDAQADAVNIVFQTKADSNPENSVGVMSMGGKG